jgi:hypothetical protein
MNMPHKGILHSENECSIPTWETGTDLTNIHYIQQQKPVSKKKKKNGDSNPDIEVHVCNPGTWKVEAGRWAVQGQPGLYSETQPQKPKQHKNVFRVWLPERIQT